MAGNSYRGINIGEWVDDAHYIVKGREILEDHSLGNIFLKIGKNDSSDPHQVYIEYLLLAPVKFLGLSGIAKNHIVELYGIYAFLGVVLLVLLIYFFVLGLSGDKLLSAASALFAVGGYTLIKLSQAPVTSVMPGLNIFSRPIMPVYGVLTLFIYINLLSSCIKQAGWKRVFWAGISFGALFYVYPYTWTFALAMTGSLFLIFIFLRDWLLVKKVLAISIIGIAIGAYTLFKMFSFQFTEIGKQILYYGTTLNHAPAPFSKILFLVLVLSLIFAYRNKWDKNSFMLLSIILANWIVLNQQIITGRVPQVMHYFWYFTIPTSIVVGSYSAWAILWSMDGGKSFLQKYGNLLLCTVIAIAFLNVARQQYLGTMATFDTKIYAQSYRPIIDALNRDPEPSVILTSEPFYGRLLLVYTDHDLFWGHATALVYNTPMERILDALYVYMFLDKSTRDDFAQRLREVDAAGGELGGKDGNSFYPLIYFFVAGFNSGFDYDEYTIRVASGDPEAIQSREKTIAFLSGEYKKIVSDPEGITNILKKAEVNYIVWDKNKNPGWDLNVVPGIQEVAAANNIYLYAFK